MKRGHSKYLNVYTKGCKIGMWTVISEIPFIDNTSYNEYCILVKCKCGLEHTLPCSRLRNGKSLGCKKCRTAGSGSYLWTGVGEISGRLLNQIKQCAKKRNIEYNLSDDFLWKLFIRQNKRCAYTGMDLILNSSHYSKNTASLDRIDSSKGYTNKNVIWVHKDVNIIKNRFDIEYLIGLCEKIYERRENIRNRNFWKSTKTD